MNRKPFHSLAESFQRGEIKTVYPSAETKVCCYLRIYPELDYEELVNASAIENLQSENGVFNVQDPRVAKHIYGYTASVDYCNEDTREIIHRFQLTRPTMAELYSALHEYAETIPDERHCSVYRKLLKEYQIEDPYT